MRTAAHHGLYDPDDPTPVLNGTRCDACGTAYFPPMQTGCEVCGSETGLNATRLAAAGTVHSVATVHMHMGKDIEAPFTMAEVQLDDGPLIRVTMTDNVDTEVIGRRVEAHWVTIRTDDGSDVVEPRFAEAAS